MRILVTAGPTREAIDPVRYLSNRSSGKMGFAIAVAAAGRGHDVTLITGPVSLPSPAGVKTVRIGTAEEMLVAVRGHVPGCEVLIMAAAVADWRPKTFAAQKQKKDVTSATLELERTPDVLQSVLPLKGERLFIGFAAETEHVVEYAQRKLVAKGLEAVVANDVSRGDAGFEVDDNQVTLVTPDAAPEAWPLMSKREVAERLVRWVEQRAC